MNNKTMVTFFVVISSTICVLLSIGISVLPPSPKTASFKELDFFYSGWGGYLDENVAQFFENKELHILAKNSNFSTANRILEFGAGDGAFALELLEKYLPNTATYLGLELAPRRVTAGNNNLYQYRHRAQIVENSVGISLPMVNNHQPDRIVSTFVIDLLSYHDIDHFFDEAHRALHPGGLLCLTSLSIHGGLIASMVSKLWNAFHWLSPSLVGGCRPLDTVALLESRLGELGEPMWEISYVHTNSFIPLETVVAQKVD